MRGCSSKLQFSLTNSPEKLVMRLTRRVKKCKLVAAAQTHLPVGQSLHQNLDKAGCQTVVPVQRRAAQLEVFNDQAEGTDQHRGYNSELVLQFEDVGDCEAVIFTVYFVQFSVQLGDRLHGGGQEQGQAVRQINKSQWLLIAADLMILMADDGVSREGSVLV